MNGLPSERSEKWVAISEAPNDAQQLSKVTHAPQRHQFRIEEQVLVA